MILKTGHKSSFAADEFKKTPEGWEFTSYPEERGYKSVRVVKSDSVAAIEITAPSQFFEAPAIVTQAPMPAGVPPVGPQTYTARPPNKSIPLRTEDGRPKAAVPVYDKEGNESQLVVDASMVG
jgi:hypothetical protein